MARSEFLPTLGGKIPSLNGVRAIAVLIVFVGHGTLAPALWPGHVGVTIFFFLSGYLITTLLRREYGLTGTISLRMFYLRRALRILPPAYLSILVAVLLGASGLLVSSTTGWGVLAEVFNYTNYYIVVAGRDGLPPDSTQLWSLGVEEHYYLIIPAVVLILLYKRLSIRRIGYILLGAGLLVPVWRVVLGLTGASFDRLYVSTDTRIDGLLFGSALALLMNPAFGDPYMGKERGARPVRPWVALAASLVLVATTLVPGQHFRLSIADVIQCACMVPIFWYIIPQAGGRVGRALNHPLVERIGVLSFSIYLFHRMVISLVGQVVEIPLFVDILALVITVAIAEVVHRLVEIPSANLKHLIERRWRDRRARPVGRSASSRAGSVT